MPESIINLLVQIPLVGIFIFFILERDKRSSISDENRDKQWRDFLHEEREARAQTNARLAEEIKSIGQEVARLNGVISAHDARAQVAIDKIVEGDKK